MKKRLSSDPIDVDLQFSVGDRVRIRFPSSTHTTALIATVIGIEIKHSLRWKRLLDSKSDIKEVSEVLYTVVTDDGELYSNENWSFYLSPHAEQNND